MTNPSPFNATAVIGLVMLSCGKRILDLGTVAAAKFDGSLLELRLHGQSQAERFEGQDAQGLWSALASAATPVAELLAAPPAANSVSFGSDVVGGTVTGGGIVASGGAIAPDHGLLQETAPAPSPYTVAPNPPAPVNTRGSSEPEADQGFPAREPTYINNATMPKYYTPPVLAGEVAHTPTRAEENASMAEGIDNGALTP